MNNNAIIRWTKKPMVSAQWIKKNKKIGARASAISQLAETIASIPGTALRQGGR